jgi:hypothetical protein
MVGEMDESDIEALNSEVHPAARGAIRDLLDSLDEDWSPFIPNILQNESSFTCSGYGVGNTFVPDMLEVVIRVHKAVRGDALGMLTIHSYERNGAIHINCTYSIGIPGGFNSWREIGGEQKGNPVVIDSRQVEYPNPSDGDRHSDEEVEEIVGNVVEEIRNLAESYDDITQKEIMEYYND